MSPTLPFKHFKFKNKSYWINCWRNVDARQIDTITTAVLIAQTRVVLINLLRVRFIKNKNVYSLLGIKIAFIGILAFKYQSHRTSNILGQSSVLLALQSVYSHLRRTPGHRLVGLCSKPSRRVVRVCARRRHHRESDDVKQCDPITNNQTR